MAFDWREFLKIAEHLRDEAGKTLDAEAALRCAVSRAYYGAFGHLLSYAAAKQGFAGSQTGKEHVDLQKHFRVRGDWVTSSRLVQLQQWRLVCDYREAKNLAQIAKESIHLAQELTARFMV